MGDTYLKKLIKTGPKLYIKNWDIYHFDIAFFTDYPLNNKSKNFKVKSWSATTCREVYILNIRNSINFNKLSHINLTIPWLSNSINPNKFLNELALNLNEMDKKYTNNKNSYLTPYYISDNKKIEDIKILPIRLRVDKEWFRSPLILSFYLLNIRFIILKLLFKYFSGCETVGHLQHEYNLDIKYMRMSRLLSHIIKNNKIKDILNLGPRASWSLTKSREGNFKHNLGCSSLSKMLGYRIKCLNKKTEENFDAYLLNLDKSSIHKKYSKGEEYKKINKYLVENK